MVSRANVPSIREQKTTHGAKPLVMVTAYDAPGARMVDEAGVDMILVGDSLAMVVLGYEDTALLKTHACFTNLTFGNGTGSGFCHGANH